jgi:hypothetical protein
MAASFCELHLQELRRRSFGLPDHSRQWLLGASATGVLVWSEAEALEHVCALCLGCVDRNVDAAGANQGARGAAVNAQAFAPIDTPGKAVGVASLTLGTFRALVAEFEVLGVTVNSLDKHTRAVLSSRLQGRRTTQTSEAFCARVRTALMAYADFCLEAALKPQQTLLRLAEALR